MDERTAARIIEYTQANGNGAIKDESANSVQEFVSAPREINRAERKFAASKVGRLRGNRPRSALFTIEGIAPDDGPGCGSR